MMPLKRLWCILFIGICVTCHTSDHTISPTKGSDNNTRKAATSGVHKDLRSQPWPDQWDTYSQDYVIRLLTPKRKGGYLISWCNAVWSRLKDNGLDSVDTAIQITNAITTAKKKDGTNVLERTWNAYQQETQWTEYLQDMCSDQILARADAHKLNTLLSNLYYLNAPISEQFINAWQRHFQRYLSYRVSLDKKLDINLPRGLYLLSLFPEHVSSKLIDEWLMVSKPYLQRFAPRGLANSILSMARLQKHPPTSWLQEWTNCASASIENFNGQELANSIYAFARLNLVPYMDWLTSWLSCSYKKMHEFTTQGLTCAVYALAQLQIDPGTQWLERWTWQFYRNMEDCTPQALVNAMQALIQLQKTPTQEWLEKWQTCVYHHINNFIPHDFAISLWSLAKLETQPSDAWLQRWLIHSQSRMHEYNHQDLANSIWALATLGVHPNPEWLQQWFTQSHNRMHEYNSQELANSIYSLSLIHATQHDATIRDIIEKAVHTIAQHIQDTMQHTAIFTPEDEMQLRWSSRYFDLNLFYSKMHIEVSDTQSSQFERNVLMYINQICPLQEKPQHEYCIPELCTCVDIAFPEPYIDY